MSDKKDTPIVISAKKNISKYIDALLSTNDKIKLNVGCGTDYKEGWVNLDNNTDENIEKLDLDWDLRNPLPFPDNSVDYIFNEHLQEHLTVEEGISVNKDFLRVLKPGGVLRIATPDLDKIVYNFENTPLSEDPVIKHFKFDFIKTRAEWMNMSFSFWGHKWIYNYEELDRRLREAGFMGVKRCEVQLSDRQDLCNIETRSGISLVVEATKKVSVTIGILTYNHEKYIKECLDSVVSQVGNFDLRVIIVNDKSKDNTDSVIRKFIADNENIVIKYDVNAKNLGAQRSIYKTLELIEETKPDYWAYIEGDDKYLTNDRTQKHIELLSSDESAIMSYNKLKLIDENSEPIVDHEPDYFSDFLTTSELAAQNHIGSFCATFYSNKVFDHFNSDQFMGLIVYDWFFNIWASQFGQIRQLGEYLSGYRQHSTSVWSSKSQSDQCWELVWSVDSYNQKFNFKYDKSFQSYKRNLINQLSAINQPMGIDIAVMSNNFLPQVGEEFVDGATKYVLLNNENTVVISTAKKTKKLLAAVRRYKQNNSEIASQIIGYDGEYNIKIGCIYATSIDDAYFSALPIVNIHNTPLVFEICKDDERKIKAKKHLSKYIKAILHSNGFVKVVVHNATMKQYFIDNKLCAEENIALVLTGMKTSKQKQVEGFRMIDDILKQCVDGTLQPAPPNIIKIVRRTYLRMTMNHNINRNTVIIKTKSIIKRNKVIYTIAKSIYGPASSA